VKKSKLKVYFDMFCVRKTCLCENSCHISICLCRVKLFCFIYEKQRIGLCGIKFYDFLNILVANVYRIQTLLNLREPQLYVYEQFCLIKIR